MEHLSRTLRGLAGTLLVGLPLLSACLATEGTEGSTDDAGESSVLLDKLGETTRYEAEDRTSESSCSVATNHAGYTGSGFMDFGGNGSRIEWNDVRTSLPGEYELTLRYANGSGGNRSASIIVNGKNAGQLSFSPTGGWPRWATQKLTVSLRTGANSVVVQANSGSGGPNLDHMDVTSVDLCPSDPNKAEPGECGCGTPEGSCGGGGGVEPGLVRQHFNGEWSSLPDFESLNADDEAVTSDVSVGPYAGTERFGLLFTGNIEIDADGRYDFEIGSDDGSRLIIDDQTVVNNDGLHGYRTRTGSIDLSRGSHAIRVTFFERTGGERLTLRYRRQGGSFANVPARMLSHGTSNPGAQPGLKRAHFNGSWSVLPDFDSLTPDAETVVEEISVGNYAGTEAFGLLFTGNIAIEGAGNYEFEVGSDDGSRLLIDGETVVDNDGLHGFRTRTGTSSLDAGRHTLRVEFFERGGGERLRVRYRRAGESFTELPAGILSHGEGGTPDGCPDDPDKTAPGVCGCGLSDLDSDGDGTPNCMDGCPDDRSKLEPGDCGCGVPDDSCAGDIITASGEHLQAGEGAAQAFDGRPNTKWLTFDDSGWLQIDFAGNTSKTVGSYTLTSANDVPARDPRDWRLLGSNDGRTWTTLDTRRGERFSARFQARTFNVATPGTYGVYRLDISSNADPASARATQLAELALHAQGGGGGTGDGGANQIQLPIEVLGAEGTQVQQTVTLSAAQASAARRLWLQVNNLGYEDKASVRVNGGPWTLLNHDTVRMQEQEAARGGMVHGGFNTIRFSVPISGLRAGDNTVSFMFNFSDGISMGYRVIAMNLLDGNGRRLMSDSDFVDDDPADWQPPYSDQASIDEGEQLWRYGDLVSNYLRQDGNWYAHSIPANVPIRAKCADCHTQDGRDLEIFAYSNHSIIERARFHGMSEEEGKKIASYIRSLSKLDKVGRYGRPWNPPYQPGPPVANRPVHEWAAGAGLEWVLDSDEDMLRHMFGKPGPYSQADIEAYFDSDEMHDTSVQPLAIQLPDWKHWLPLIHPKDAFPGYYDSYRSGRERRPEEGLKTLRGQLEADAGNYDLGDYNKLDVQMLRFYEHFRFFFEEGASHVEHWRSRGGDALESMPSWLSPELAATSLARLLAVKSFEINNEFDLQAVAMDVVDPREQPRARSWFARNYGVFEVPAHFTACFKSGGERCDNFEGQPRATGAFETTSWYQLQQVINPGIAISRGVGPVDYNYMATFILRAGSTSGIHEPVRFYYVSNVGYQTRTRNVNPYPADDTRTRGFNMRSMGPWMFYGTDNRNNFEGYDPGEIPQLLNDIQPNLGRMIVESQLKQFLREMNKSENRLSDWARRSSVSSGNHSYLDPASLTTSELNPRDFHGETRHYAHKIYYAIPRYIDLGVGCRVIEDLKAWTKDAWPRIDWNFTCR